MLLFLKNGGIPASWRTERQMRSGLCSSSSRHSGAVLSARNPAQQAVVALFYSTEQAA